ncbi:ras-related protein Rap-2b-like [Nilaparvata lugens]|uniref:ras-related protein Rap-2b-like n=1 Tax=Nilaparvata lugens TaxID=108931 RepID=UPI00193D20B6|nr:ras-related protein Rap-2b-like [Nilaparvata lugens]
MASETHLEDEGECQAETGPGAGSCGVGGIKHKIVVMGAARVGKSSLIQQFLYSTFTPKYKRTVEEMHHGDFTVAGVHLTLDILDTSGSFEFPAMRALSISSADAFILVYSVVDAATFDEARVIRDQIIETKGNRAVPIVVVGNKLDLADESREVSFETTESIVTVDWENGFVEASAKDNINVTQVFKELLTQAKVKYNLSPALRRRRRQSLPMTQGGLGGGANTPNPAIPSAAQLAHLQRIQEKHAASGGGAVGAGGKRNSCVIS